MVQELNGGDDTNASFYAGLLVSAFAAAEACTAMIWGTISDRYGRKPIILIGLAGTGLSSLMFGFAKNYWTAFAARVIGGLLNGNVAVMQTMVAEMVKRPEHERKSASSLCRNDTLLTLWLSVISSSVRCESFYVVIRIDCWGSYGWVSRSAGQILSLDIS